MLIIKWWSGGVVEWWSGEKVERWKLRRSFTFVVVNLQNIYPEGTEYEWHVKI